MTVVQFLESPIGTTLLVSGLVALTLSFTWSIYEAVKGRYR